MYILYIHKQWHVFIQIWGPPSYEFVYKAINDRQRFSIPQSSPMKQTVRQAMAEPPGFGKLKGPWRKLAPGAGAPLLARRGKFFRAVEVTVMAAPRPKKKPLGLYDGRSWNCVGDDADSGCIHGWWVMILTVWHDVLLWCVSCFGSFSTGEHTEQPHQGRCSVLHPYLDSLLYLFVLMVLSAACWGYILFEYDDGGDGDNVLSCLSVLGEESIRIGTGTILVADEGTKPGGDLPWFTK